MLDLYADWCVSCKEFEHKTFSDHRVQRRFGQMVLLQADVTPNDDLDNSPGGNYLGGSGSHPGGGLTCAPGHHAATAILAD